MMIFLLAILGLLLSAYALYVKQRAAKSKTYKPLCDISAHISCTKAFLSKEGSFAGMPNPVYGLLFYAAVLVLSWVGQQRIIFYLSIPAVLGSVYLAYVSYVRQRNFCLVCTAIYLVNVGLLIAS